MLATCNDIEIGNGWWLMVINYSFDKEIHGNSHSDL